MSRPIRNGSLDCGRELQHLLRRPVVVANLNVAELKVVDDVSAAGDAEENRDFVDDLVDRPLITSIGSGVKPGDRVRFGLASATVAVTAHPAQRSSAVSFDAEASSARRRSELAGFSCGGRAAGFAAASDGRRSVQLLVQNIEIALRTWSQRIGWVFLQEESELGLRGGVIVQRNGSDGGDIMSVAHSRMIEGVNARRPSQLPHDTGGCRSGHTPAQ